LENGVKMFNWETFSQSFHQNMRWLQIDLYHVIPVTQI